MAKNKTYLTLKQHILPYMARADLVPCLGYSVVESHYVHCELCTFPYHVQNSDGLSSVLVDF